MVLKKKKGSPKKATPPLPPFDFQPPTVLVHPSEYVRCRICSVALSHLNFEWPAVPTEITLSIIKDAIYKRHGGTALGLALYKDQVQEDCLIRQEDGASLRDCGVQGIISGHPDELPIVTLWYDFLPVRSDDAIITVESEVGASSHGLTLKGLVKSARE